MAPPKLPPGVQSRRGGASGGVSRAGGRRVARRSGNSGSGGNSKSKTDHIRGTDMWERTDDSKLLKRAKKLQRKQNRDEDQMEGISAKGCGAILGGLMSVLAFLVLLNPNQVEIDSPERAATALADSCVLIGNTISQPMILFALLFGGVGVVCTVKLWQKVKHDRVTAAEAERVASEALLKQEVDKKKWEEKQARREKYREAEEAARKQRLEEIKAQALQEQLDREVEIEFQNEMAAAAEAAGDEDKWTQEQQDAFEDALADNPSRNFRTSKERFTVIAELVDGKTIAECVRRFRKIREMFNEQQQGTTSLEDHEIGGEVGLENWLSGENAAAYADRFLYVDDDESSSEDDESGDERSARDRLVVDVQSDPKPGWAKLVLNGLSSTNIGVSQPATLRLQMACEKCGETSEQTVGGVFVDHSAHTWHCGNCSSTNRAELIPCFLHVNNTTVGYVNCTNCEVHDILRVSLIAQCLQCGGGLGGSRSGLGDLCVMNEVKRGVRSEVNCRDCHTKLALQVSAFSVEQVSGQGELSSTVDDAWNKKQQAQKKRVVKKKGGSYPAKPQGTFKVGTSLPDNGACKHFRKSYRWMRFPCCGRAFPCPICHAASGCEESNVATRMICGKCSFESGFANRACSNCEFHMGIAKSKGGSKYWNGGDGARSTTTLSKKDTRKHKGSSRSGVAKTTSKKSERVGKAGKKNREG